MVAVQFYKKPQTNKELQSLHYLNSRMKLPVSSFQTYENLQKGYAGERKFHQILRELLSSHCIVLFDLLLESNGTTFQIDCLLIFYDTVFLIEIKNFEGDFYINGDNWYAVATKNEIRNPLLQLERSEFLLRHFLQKHKYNFVVKPYVVFVNNAFTLYGALIKLPIVFPTQLYRFIRTLNNTNSRVTYQHKRLANHFIRHHMKDSPFERLPEYKLHQLRKGISCNHCRSFVKLARFKIVTCQNCGYKESLSSAIMRSVVEFSILFPNEKITVSKIHEWCAFIVSKKVIRRILLQYMTLIRKSQLSYYEFK